MLKLLFVASMVIGNLFMLRAQNMVAQGYNLTQFNDQPRPIGMVFDSSGNLFVSDYSAPTRAIYHIDIVNGIYVSETIVASGNSTEFKPQYLAIDDNDNIYFTKSNSNDGGVYTLSPSGVIDVIYVPSGMDLMDPRGVAFNSTGDLFVACNNYGTAGGAYIAKFELNSSNQVVAQDLNFIGPFDNLMDLHFDSVGNLYAAGVESLIKIEFDSNEAVASVDPYFCILPASVPSDFFVAGIAIDPDGDMLVSQVNKFNLDSGKIYQVDASGNYSLFASGFSQPRDLAFDSDNRLYVSDSEDGMIYMIECDDQGRSSGKATFCHEALTAINDFSSESSFSLFPNPTNGLFSAKFNSDGGNVQIELINSLGQSKTLESYNSEGQYSFDINNETAGLYTIVFIRDGIVVHSSRLIKE